MLAKLVGLMLSKLRFKECDGRYHINGGSPTWHEMKDSSLVSYHSIGGGNGDLTTIIRLGSRFGNPFVPTWRARETFENFKGNIAWKSSLFCVG